MRYFLWLLPVLWIGACVHGADYDFRDDARPSYDQTVPVADLADWMEREAIVVDVRLAEDVAEDPERIVGAIYRDPDTIAHWASELPADRPIIVYCVKGKWVSQKAANYLSNAGLEVYNLAGGLRRWQSYSDTLD